MTHNKRGSIATAIGVSLTLLLSACTPGTQLIGDTTVQQGEDANPELVKTRFWGHLDDLTTLIGGTWYTEDDPLASGCGQTDNRGFEYSAGRTRNEPVDDFQATTQAVRELWESKGYDISSASYRDAHQILTIDTAEGDSLTFTVDNNMVTLSGRTACYPGDWVKIRNDDGEELLREQSPAPTPMPNETSNG